MLFFSWSIVQIHISYIVYRWWAFGLFPNLGYYEWCCHEYWCLFWCIYTCIFICLGMKLLNHVVGSALEDNSRRLSNMFKAICIPLAGYVSPCYSIYLATNWYLVMCVFPISLAILWAWRVQYYYFYLHIFSMLSIFLMLIGHLDILCCKVSAKYIFYFSIGLSIFFLWLETVFMFELFDYYMWWIYSPTPGLHYHFLKSILWWVDILNLNVVKLSTIFFMIKIPCWFETYLSWLQFQVESFHYFSVKYDICYKFIINTLSYPGSSFHYYPVNMFY